MSEWMVRLMGPERDLRFLLRSLQGPDCRVTENGGEFYLRSSELEGLTGASEVKQVADKIVDGANLIAPLDFEPYRGVRTGEVVRVDPEGTHHLTLFAAGFAAGEATVFGFATVVGSQPAPPPDLLRRIAVVQQQPAMADALRYVGNEPNWYGYYKAYEAVRDANGGDRGLRKRGWTTKPALSRFTYSAQPHRHHDQPGPDDRMSEAEARAFVVHLLRQWRDEELSGSA